MLNTSTLITVSSFSDFYNGALKIFEAKRASRIGVRVLDITQVISGCRKFGQFVCVRQRTQQCSKHRTLLMMTILFLELRPKKRHATWSEQVREKFVTFFCKKIENADSAAGDCFEWTSRIGVRAL